VDDLLVLGRGDPTCPQRQSEGNVVPPGLGRSNPAIMFSRVVFPQPDGPMMEMNSPSLTVNETRSTAGIADPFGPVNCLQTP